MKTKKPTLLIGGCVEICLNKVMSPSPGELLFDASAQSPPSDKTVEMLDLEWHKFFMGVCFCRLVIFCVLSGLNTNFSTY